MKVVLPDYYNLLLLPYGASENQIRVRFRALAKKYHPDNLFSGQEERFKEILNAYHILSDFKTRKEYDRKYLIFQKYKSTTVIPLDRIIHPGAIPELAKKGLLRAGMRSSDRRKYTGINYDLVIMVKKEEMESRLQVNIPLTVRIVCPECMGSNLHCSSCNGRGSYKSSRFLKVVFEPGIIKHNRIYEFELGHFRPEPLVYFKKKSIRIKAEVV